MTSRASKAVRAQVKQSGRKLKAVVKDLAEAARDVAEKHGAKRSVTIIKGQTVSKDKPTKIKIVRD